MQTLGIRGAAPARVAWRPAGSARMPAGGARMMESPPPAALPAALRAGVVAATLVAAAAAAATPPVDSSAGFPLRDGDRVVLIGDTFVEREGQRGFVETALVASKPAASIRFRNLGWSGDTVWAESRGVFDPPKEGYRRLLALVGELAPTVAVLAYGRNESERGEAGLSAFAAQLTTLCDDLRKAAGDSRPLRLVLVTPHPFFTTDSAPRNRELARYADVIRDVAARQGASLVDLFGGFGIQEDGAAAAVGWTGRPITENGVHLSDAGYARAARIFAAASGFSPSGDFESRLAKARQLVVEKNTLFFHRWRPANETYIFLFRKHEQGNNAAEIPRFDPLVEEAERKARLAIRESMAGGS
jgi:lysophospholipase L1-like esterase